MATINSSSSFPYWGTGWATPSSAQNLHMTLSLEVILRDSFAMLGIELRVVMYKKKIAGAWRWR